MADLVQLLDMGIPRARAQAALRRSKGDAMAAAERVFAGEFDDVPSDDDGDHDGAAAEDDRSVPFATGLQTPDESTSQTAPPSQGVQEVSLEDSDGDDDLDTFDEFGDGDYEMDGFSDNDDEKPRMQDPYAGIFFSKDRVERLIEAIPDELYADVKINGVKTRLNVLTREQWMSGCPEGGEQSFLFQLYNSLAEGHMPCSNGCGHKFARAPNDFFALFPTFVDYTTHLANTIEKQCPKCSRMTCFACGETAATDAKGKGKAKGAASAPPDSLFHCSNIQGVIIGIGLELIDRAFFRPVPVIPSTTASPPAKKRKVKRSMLSKVLSGGGNDGSDASDSESDVFYSKTGKSAPKGTGYSGNTREDNSGQLAAEKAQAITDRKTAELLSQVMMFLPTLRREPTHTSDFMVHPTALAHVRRRSAFVSDLLHNDSLVDMTNRDAIYRALFDWLEVVSNHEALAPMLAMPQMRPTRIEPGPDANTHYVTYEGNPSPREMLEMIVIQATAALKGLSATSVSRNPALQGVVNGVVVQAAPEAVDGDTRNVDGDTRNVALKTFCERIIKSAEIIDRQLVDTKGREFVDRMRSSLPKIHHSDSDENVTAADTEEATKAIYEAWAKRVRFQYCSLIDPSDPTKKQYRHAFDASLNRLVGMDAPRRSLAIAKELGVLTTNLPTAWGSSVFLRVDEDRVDAIKAMIIGPADTPYENGCFIFDIFLPIEYNQSCPNVKFMTTHGGTQRLNPNLYADGKVCLSLLGTWAGPGWIAGKSTLLQVLISIQALILVAVPYINEPGWADQGNTAASKAYSADVRRMVLIDAIGNSLRDPPFPFENEIKTHFRLKANSIRAQLDAWKLLDDGRATQGDYFAGTGTAAAAGPSGTAFDKAAAEVRRLLDELAPPAPAARASARAAPVTPRRSARKK